MTETKSQRIAELNDKLRKNAGLFSLQLDLGEVIVTSGIAAMEEEDHRTIFEQIRKFDQFAEDNDPWGEHDFGIIKHKGQSIYWKIDYYDPTRTYLSDDPSDVTKTWRVLTVLLASEY